MSAARPAAAGRGRSTGPVRRLRRAIARFTRRLRRRPDPGGPGAGTPDRRARSIGRRGERIAARRMRRDGYRILARNLTIGRDEADLVLLAPDGRTLVVVEVKTTTDGRREPPGARVGPAQRRRLVRLGGILVRSGPWRGCPVRYDVVGVRLGPGRRVEFRHEPAAFGVR